MAKNRKTVTSTAMEAIAALKEQMTREVCERDAVIERLRTERWNLYREIGDVLEPGKGNAPCVYDAAVDDVKEIGHQRDEARRTLAACKERLNALSRGRQNE